MQFLTPELREYYAQDFIRVLRGHTDSYWEVHPKIIPSLLAINKDPQLHTLYSSYPSGNHLGSFVELAYTRAYAERLNRKLKSVFSFFANELHLPFVMPTLKECLPWVNSQADDREILGCQNNPEYFNIHHIHIGIESDIPWFHDVFWKHLETALV